ncbi:MAG: thermonuclease family protein [Rhodospirillaceae bacterium]|nr:thermonuclease family protein [Rhodospirillaceae bacterium]
MLRPHQLIRALIITALLSLAGTTAFADTVSDGRYDWPVLGAIDGDTLKVHLPGLPMELQPMKVRVRGIDTPEIRGKCDREKQAANKATALTRFLISQAKARKKSIVFSEIGWDKYGGRLDAIVTIDGQSLGAILISAGLARAYDGGKRMGWC